MHAHRSRRRALLSWVPAGVLLLVIAGVVLATVAVENSWWAREDPPPSAQQQASDGSTMLTDAGFDYATSRALFRLRLGDGAPTAAELGMDADDARSAEFRVPVRAVIAVADDVWSLRDVGGVDVASVDGAVRSATVTVDSLASWNAGVARAHALAADFGWDPATIDAWNDGLAAHYRSGAETPFTAEVSADSGAAVVRGELTTLPGATGAVLAVTFEP